MDYDKLLNMGVELGYRLMFSGAEIYRVEESVYRLLRAYGQEVQVFALPTALFVSITTPQGHTSTKMRRIPAHGTDIELLERCNDLCRRLCRDCPPMDTAKEMIDGLLVEGQQYPRQIILLGYGAAAAFFCLFFGGSFADGLCAGLCGVTVGFVLVYGEKLLGSNNFIRTTLCSALASLLALLLVQLGLGDNVDTVTIGTFMLLVPGMALTNAMREIMAGDIFSGLSRTAEVLLVGAAIALGSAIALAIGMGL